MSDGTYPGASQTSAGDSATSPIGGAGSGAGGGASTTTSTTGMAGASASTAPPPPPTQHQQHQQPLGGNTPPVEWVTTWNLFDDRQSGAVSATDFKHILRCLGRRHTEAEFRELLRPLPDPVPYARFLEVMRRPYHGPTEDDLVTALSALGGAGAGSGNSGATLDGGNNVSGASASAAGGGGGGGGRLRVRELVTLLSSLGEKMPEAEVRQLLAEVRTDADGTVTVAELAAFLSTPVPSTTPEIVELRRQLGQSA